MGQNIARLITLGESVLGGLANQTARRPHLVHYFITGINTRGTSNALKLQPMTNIDPGRANLNTDTAVDTVAQILLCFWPGVLPSPAAWFATIDIVSDNQRIRGKRNARAP